MVFYYLPIHAKDLKALITEILAPKQNVGFYEPSLAQKGGAKRINLTSFQDSLHTGSYNYVIYSKALKTIIKEIKHKT